MSIAWRKLGAYVVFVTVVLVGIWGWQQQAERTDSRICQGQNEIRRGTLDFIVGELTPTTTTAPLAEPPPPRRLTYPENATPGEIHIVDEANALVAGLGIGEEPSNDDSGIVERAKRQFAPISCP